MHLCSLLSTTAVLSTEWSQTALKSAPIININIISKHQFLLEHCHLTVLTVKCTNWPFSIKYLLLLQYLATKYNYLQYSEI